MNANETSIQGPQPSFSYDYDRFESQATPIIPLDMALPFRTAAQKITLAHVWDWFRESSLFGREVPTENAPLGASRAYFVPLLSAMKLFLPAADDLESSLAQGQGKESDGGSMHDNAIQSVRHRCKIPSFPGGMALLAQYQSPHLPWDRRPLYHEVLALSASPPSAALPEPSALLSTSLLQLHPASWIAIWWQPTYRIPDMPLDAKFLVYYSFSSIFHRLQEPDVHSAELRLAVSGMMCAATAGERWLEGTPAWWAGSGRGARTRDPGLEDSMFKARVSELQASAKRIALGLDVELLGEDGSQKDEAAHSDFTFMCKQRLSA